jgi:hypothetical protein
MRIAYSPGSEAGRFDLNQDADALFRAPPENVFAVKVDYRMVRCGQGEAAGSPSQPGRWRPSCHELTPQFHFCMIAEQAILFCRITP